MEIQINMNINNKLTIIISKRQVFKRTNNIGKIYNNIIQLVRDVIVIVKYFSSHKNIYNIQVKNFLQKKKQNQSINVFETFNKLSKSVLNIESIVILPFVTTTNKTPITSTIKITTSQTQFNNYCHGQNINASSYFLY